MRRRNTILIVTAVVLALLSVALYFLASEETVSETDRDYFKLQETEKMDEVKMISHRDTVQLKYENSRWTVNNTWDADVQLIKVLFATLRQVEPRRPVAAALKDSVINTLKTQGTLVAISEAGVEQLSFLAGGNADKTEAWFLKAGDSQPYVMNIPGYRVYSSGIFEVDHNGWRSKRVFDFNWRNFKTLSVSFPLEKKNDFEVTLQGKYFGIRNMDRSDTTKLNDFLDNISLLFADRYVAPGSPEFNKQKDLPVIVRFGIKDIANRMYALDILPSGKQDREVFGRLANGELVVFNRNAVAGIMRKRDYFLPGR